MVVFCRIATECRSSIIGPNSSCTARDFSDFRVVEWRRNLPHTLRFDNSHPEYKSSEEPRSHYRLRLLLYLRANQMRTVIRRHSAIRPGPGNTDTSSMQTAIEIACDTIRILVTVVQSSDVYQAQQKTFNYFLESAISSLLLGVSHRKDIGEPSHFEELHMVMGLVRGLATKSQMMRKLCDKLERLKVVQAALKLGTQGTAPHGTMQSSSKQTRASGPVMSSPEASMNSVDPLPTSALTPVSDDVSRPNHGDSGAVHHTSQDGIDLSGISPQAAFTGWTGAPQSRQAHLATIATESRFQPVQGVSCSPELASIMNPRFDNESAGVSCGAERAQGDDMDDLQDLFFADLQVLLGQPDNTFAF